MIPTCRPIAGPFRSVHLPLEITWLPLTRPDLLALRSCSGVPNTIHPRAREAQSWKAASGRAVARKKMCGDPVRTPVSGRQTSIEVGLTAFRGPCKKSSAADLGIRPVPGTQAALEKSGEPAKDRHSGCDPSGRYTSEPHKGIPSSVRPKPPLHLHGSACTSDALGPARRKECSAPTSLHEDSWARRSRLRVRESACLTTSRGRTEAQGGRLRPDPGLGNSCSPYRNRPPVGGQHSGLTTSQFIVSTTRPPVPGWTQRFRCASVSALGLPVLDRSGSDFEREDLFPSWFNSAGFAASRSYMEVPTRVERGSFRKKSTGWNGLRLDLPFPVVLARIGQEVNQSFGLGTEAKTPPFVARGSALRLLRRWCGGRGWLQARGATFTLPAK